MDRFGLESGGWRLWRRLGVCLALLPLLVGQSLVAGRPLVVDDAWAVEPGVVEFEAGVAYLRTDTPHSYDIPLALTAGVLPDLEVGIGFGGVIEVREDVLSFHQADGGLGDLTAGLKWNPLSADRWFADHALAFGVKFPTANGNWGTGQTDFDLTYIASRMLSELWSVHFNVGYTWIGDTDEMRLEDVFHAGLAAGWLVQERIELVGEVYTGVPIGREWDSGLSLGGGVRWNVFGACTLDAYLGSGLAGGAPEWVIAAGLTCAFDFERDKRE